MTDPAAMTNPISILDRLAGRNVPGLQYLAVDARGPRFEYAGGWADLGARRPMTPDTTLMAYSMTKTLTAAAVLQLVERGRLDLDGELDACLPATPYASRGITIRHLLAHTSGIPNPIPLRWAHLSDEAAAFDEAAALDRVLRRYPRLVFPPGARFAYSNIGYWLLGRVIAQAAGQPYVDYLSAGILTPLGLTPLQMGFTIPDPANHAGGYLARYTLMNLLKRWLVEPRFLAGYEGSWLRFRSHHLNGPSFGGLLGSARGFGRLLQDQLQPESALFNQSIHRLFETPQRDASGRPLPMTLGWHLGAARGQTYLYKQGGGGGFHGEMRLYPARQIGTVVMTNSTTFNSTQLLNHLDPAFL